MLPKWFNLWNRENPTNVFGPAILVGVLGGAVSLAILIVVLGQPYATDSLQTGPRGTGMSVTEFESDLNTPDPDIALLMDCLLYTSPSPRDEKVSRMPSSA